MLDSESQATAKRIALSPRKSTARKALGDDVAPVLDIVPEHEAIEVASAGEEHAAFGRLRQTLSERASGQALLTDAELDYYAAHFSISGFTGPINWYRNWSDNWRQLDGVSHQIEIPTLFIGAVHDVVIDPRYIEGMKPLVSDLTIHMLDCGHWTQQERPDDVNRLLLAWL